MPARKDIDKLVRAAKRHGVREEITGSGHRKLLLPDGGHIIVPWSPRSNIATKHLERELKKRGLL